MYICMDVCFSASMMWYMIWVHVCVHTYIHTSVCVCVCVHMLGMCVNDRCLHIPMFGCLHTSDIKNPYSRYKSAA